MSQPTEPIDIQSRSRQRRKAVAGRKLEKEELLQEARNEAAGELVEGLHYNLEAEESVIACLIAEPKALVNIMRDSRLPVEYFYFEKMRHCYEAIQALYAEDNSRLRLEFKILKAALTRMGVYAATDSESAARPEYVTAKDLYRLCSYTEANPVNLKRYIKFVRDAALARQSLSLAAEVHSMATNPQIKPKEVLSHVQSRLLELTNGHYDEGGHKYYSTYDKDTMLHFQNWSEADKARLRRLPLTGIPDFDGEDLRNLPFGMFNAGKVSLILAHTSNGKTSLALQILLASLKAGRNVVYATTEENINSLQCRLISTISGVPYKLINLHLANIRMHSQSELEALNLASLSLTGEEVEINGERHCYPGRMLLIECSGWGGQQICNEVYARHEGAKLNEFFYNRGFDAVILDYIQGTGADSFNRREREEQVLLENMRALEQLAIKTDFSVIALSQVAINRMEPDDKLQVKFPTLEAGKNCTGLANTADTVLGLALSSGRDKAFIKLLKAREGKVGEILQVGFEGARYRFY